MIALRTDEVKMCTEGRWHEVGRALIGLDSGRFRRTGLIRQFFIPPVCRSSG